MPDFHDDSKVRNKVTKAFLVSIILISILYVNTARIDTFGKQVHEDITYELNEMKGPEIPPEMEKAIRQNERKEINTTIAENLEYLVDSTNTFSGILAIAMLSVVTIGFVIGIFDAFGCKRGGY